MSTHDLEVCCLGLLSRVRHTPATDGAVWGMQHWWPRLASRSKDTKVWRGYVGRKRALGMLETWREEEPSCQYLLPAFAYTPCSKNIKDVKIATKITSVARLAASVHSILRRTDLFAGVQLLHVFSTCTRTLIDRADQYGRVHDPSAWSDWWTEDERRTV
jgi:hypothetical protein